MAKKARKVQSALNFTPVATRPTALPVSSTAARSWWTAWQLHAGLLVVVCFAVYSNSFQHAYHLDDAHVLVTNLSIRSLKNIPRYFVDAGTFTSLRANVDYRPVLQVTYALNFWMGGYDTKWWHLTQILLHAVCAIGIYFLCRRVLSQTPEASIPAINWAIPLAAALIFAVHPTASGVVNYLSARSSLLTAAFLLPALLLYMVPRGDPGYDRLPWAATLLFALALFTKVEAIAALGVCMLYEVWQTAITRPNDAGFLRDLRHTVKPDRLKRLAPWFVVAVIYFVIRQIVLAPFEFEEARRAADITNFQYLLTQTVVWWHYVLKWFAPTNLVADYGDYPIYRSVFAGPVLLAIAGWVLVAGLVVAVYKRRPYILFLALSGLALISPTSSIAPLAEMLNEHRPYLPMGVFSLAWLIPLGAVVLHAARERPPVRGFAMVAMVLLLLGLGSMTRQRNLVFVTERSYLEDLVAKAPSGRALNNYGLIFMREGDYNRALDLFQQALEYTPNWHIVHINLAVVYQALGQLDLVQRHLDLAVKDDIFSGEALTWRAEHYLRVNRFQEALQDLEAARPRSLENYRIAKDMATAYAGLGDVDRSVQETRRCLELDPAQTAVDIVAIAKPYFDFPGLNGSGLAYFEQLDRIIPDTWWVQANISTLASRLGDTARAEAAAARAEALRN
jgi:protein O-mannosyl-transferase